MIEKNTDTPLYRCVRRSEEVGYLGSNGHRKDVRDGHKTVEGTGEPGNVLETPIITSTRRARVFSTTNSLIRSFTHPSIEVFDVFGQAAKGSHPKTFA